MVTMVRAFLARDTIGSGSVGRLTHSGIWTLPPSRSTTITSTYTQKNTGQWIHPLTHHIPYCLTNVWFKLGTNIHYIENIYLVSSSFHLFWGILLIVFSPKAASIHLQEDISICHQVLSCTFAHGLSKLKTWDFGSIYNIVSSWSWIDAALGE